MKLLTFLKLSILFLLVETSYSQAELISFSRAEALSNYTGRFVQDMYGEMNGDYIHSKANAETFSANAGSELTVGYGVIKGSIGGVSGDLGSGAAGQIQGGFTDKISLSNPTLNGQKGEITVAYHYDYTLAIRGYHTSTLASFMGILGQNIDNKVIHTILTSGEDYYRNEVLLKDDFGTRHHLDSTAGLLFVTSEFYWGSDIDIGLSVILQGSSGYSSAFTVNALNSGYWAGIQSVSHDGFNISDFELTSKSGTDYSKSFVPHVSVSESSSLILCSLGLLVLAMRRINWSY